MWARIRKLLLPPVFEGDEEKTNRASLIYSLLIIIIVTTIMFPMLSLVAGAPIEFVVGILVTILVVTAISLIIFVRLGYVQPAAIILGIVWWALFTFGIFNFGGLHDTAITGFFFLIILASIVGGWRALLGFSVLAIISFITVYISEQMGTLIPDIKVPSDSADLAMPIVVITASTLILRMSIRFQTKTYEQVRKNADQLEAANLELQSSQNELASQAQELERRARYLEANAIIARNVAAELDPNTLLRRVVTLISDQFDFYHTGIFLIDPTGSFAVLESASSRGGQRMLERGHRLRVGQEGIVGYVASQGRSRVALDTGEDAVYFDNPDLPDTRSEVALPLRVRGQVMGVLVVQSTESKAFNDQDIAVLETMADQIAIALQNAQLFQRVEESIETQRRAYGELSRDSWERLTREQRALGYQYIRGRVIPSGEAQSPETGLLPEVKIPIQLGDEIIGHITAHKSGETENWSSDEINIIENLSSQLSVALESARLYQDTQLRAAREQLTGEVTARIRETLDIETMLKIASDEIRKALNLPEVVIRLGEPISDPTQGATE